MKRCFPPARPHPVRKQWTSDRQYDKFVKDYVRKEPGLKALERTIVYLAKWSEESDNKWQDYFVEASPSRAVHDIRAAKISPWVIYLSQTGNKLLARFNDEQVKMIEEMIDPPFWMKLFTTSKEEVKEIKQTCKDANI